MARRFAYLASVLAVGAAAAAIGLAPIASAADTPSTQTSCTDAGTDTVCQSPGNVQINDSPPVDFTPQYPYWEGGYGYGGGYHGGGHR
jgi:hypothetical protein